MRNGDLKFRLKKAMILETVPTLEMMLSHDGILT
jgi:hypothetical protein